ncbi:hypothetical protein SAMN05444487_11286 [Marininema mesophilum]|uniref:Enoyl reductase (ER) domain-containing protein n=1 Tax=Marininema mesophilum TaxID=1048340 RepID=A0A1H3A164_9BACL|nr:NADP-dependent oxidoreductase [Marininema mesophilum]SDX23323.1 hypothetical protein SAMN05444487_11286 [Marininema mesophilum]
MSTINRQIYFMERPHGTPNENTFELRSSDIPKPGPGEVLLRTVYLSVDPYMRGRMSDRKSYVAPFELNEVLSGGVVGQVEISNDDRFQAGDLVVGLLGWQDYSVVKADQLNKIDANLASPSAYLGALGMPGLTAYFGLLDIGQPQAGETVVVSGAAGAVGTIVGQIAKIKGARVVGIAGSGEKVRYLKEELGFDAVINYKTENVQKALEEACPNGVDVYFDNVGGEISDAVATLFNKYARVPLCGQISLYNLKNPEHGPRVQTSLLINSALMKGFIVSDYQSRFPEGVKQLGEWVAQGKIVFQENIVEGLENTPQAFLGLFKGENLGKQLVKVSDVQ